MSSTPTVLHKYRTLLRLIQRLPEPKRTSELDTCRAMFRENMDALASHADTIRTTLDDKIRYLRIITPKRPGDVEHVDEASITYVLRDGRLEQARSRKEKRVADGRISMSEAYERHQSLLKRMNFGRDPKPYDPSTF